LNLKFFQKLEKFISYTIKVAQAARLCYFLCINTISCTIEFEQLKDICGRSIIKAACEIWQREKGFSIAGIP
jgi:hypothetical protein